MGWWAGGKIAGGATISHHKSCTGGFKSFFRAPAVALHDIFFETLYVGPSDDIGSFALCCSMASISLTFDMQILP